MGHRLKSFITRIRRNHALEHATVHLLSVYDPTLRLVGRTDWTGFWLYGEVTTAAVRRAAHEALRRLADGEKALAIHPNCGTNIAAATILGGLGAFLAARILRRSRAAQWLGVVAAFLTTASLGHSAGQMAQRHISTTSQMRGLRIVAIERERSGDWAVHHIITG